MTIVTVDPTIPDVLSSAATLIETHGWNQLDMWTDCCKEVPWTPGTPCCALAAIIVASGHTEIVPGVRQLPAVRYMANWVAELGYPDTRDDRVYAFTISNWNDARGRCATEVINGLRLAAITARAQIEEANQAQLEAARQAEAATLGGSQLVEEVPADADTESHTNSSA